MRAFPWMSSVEMVTEEGTPAVHRRLPWVESSDACRFGRPGAASICRGQLGTGTPATLTDRE